MTYRDLLESRQCPHGMAQQRPSRLTHLVLSTVVKAELANRLPLCDGEFVNEIDAALWAEEVESVYGDGENACLIENLAADWVGLKKFRVST